MGKFIRESVKTSVSLDGGQNVIWLRERLDRGQAARITNALTGMGDMSGNGANMRQQILLNIGTYNNVLLEHYIIDWDGPDFEEDGRKVPFSRQALESLPEEYPLLNAALEKIVELRKREEKVGADADPLSGITGSSEHGSGALVSLSAKKQTR